MPGGILSWVDEGYPVYEADPNNQTSPQVESGYKVTKRIHVCIKEFSDLGPDGYDCVYT